MPAGSSTSGVQANTWSSSRHRFASAWTNSTTASRSRLDDTAEHASRPERLPRNLWPARHHYGVNVVVACRPALGGSEAAHPGLLEESRRHVPKSDTVP